MAETAACSVCQQPCAERAPTCDEDWCRYEWEARGVLLDMLHLDQRRSKDFLCEMLRTFPDVPGETQMQWRLCHTSRACQATRHRDCRATLYPHRFHCDCECHQRTKETDDG